MIQRIQSIWLFLAALSMGCLLFIPMVTSTIAGVEYYVIASGLYQKLGKENITVEANLPLLLVAGVASILCFINIFNYKKRQLQRRLIFISIIYIIIISFWCSQQAKKIPGGLEDANYKVGMFLPVMAIAFCVLAVRGINNDEKLLKSADRLR
ncbi:MAG: DUF4293 domain-containing protein [Pedobacter sp.]|nr:DUF4293 domain-containing protein [Pedobacter sp.]